MSAPEIFVFGSNLAGRHGAGSAAHAREFYGAQTGVGEGMTGRAYAIPTKDGNLSTLPLERIKLSVDTFLMFAKGHPDWRFDVVAIGCGLAGYAPSQIAPMFRDATLNVKLPVIFLAHLGRPITLVPPDEANLASGPPD